MDSILVLRLSSVGDIVLTEPAVAALRECFPGAAIGYAVKAQFRDLVASHPALSRVHLLDTSSSGGMASLVREIRGARYSAVVDLHRNTRTARILRAVGVPVRTAYRKREFRDAVRVRLLRRPFRASKLLVQRYLDALVPLGIDASYTRPRLHISDLDAEAGRATLAGLDIGSDAYAVLVPGSVWATKQWPAGRFAELATGVVRELGLRVVFLGSPGERELCERIAVEAGSGAVSAAGETTLGQMAAVISRARIFVGNDSGPTHMARALDVPTVAVFGPTDPGQFDFDGHALVYRDLSCSACTFYGSRRCHLGHWNCMRTIEHDDVLDGARSLLSSDGGGQ
ncbi:glycosyltransferase family 9 protein [bacterium]|nr:glycosyltransferase family 9 protein [bacterium]